MIGWFCNAIMRGYDEATWRNSAELAALRSRVRELEEAGRAFVEIYHRVEPEMIGVFAFRQLHLGPYSGPNWKKELDALEAILERKI